jgi:hypothetical protein
MQDRINAIFPAAEDPDLLSDIADTWDFVEGFPIPKFDLPCICAAPNIKLVTFKYGIKDVGKISQTGGQEQGCLVVCRCRYCGLNYVYNVALTREQFDLRSPYAGAIDYHWERALAIIKGTPAPLDPVGEMAKN